MSVSTHVLDGSRGAPARGMRIRLERFDETGGRWLLVRGGVTDDEGRLSALTGTSGAGRYRLVFDSGRYFADRGTSTFFPEVVVMFQIVDPRRHHHVPLHLSPFAYSTCRRRC